MSQFVQYISDMPEWGKSLLVLLLLFLALIVFKAIFGKSIKSDDEAAGPESENLDEGEQKSVRAWGKTTLIDTDEKTAAVIMAIVSERLSVPLERLYFESIKCIDEPTLLEGVSDSEAAVIMAVTSHMTGKPLENLDFGSIKLVSE